MEISLESNPNTISLDEFLLLPETKPASEYIDGQVYQKPMPQFQHSIFQAEIVNSINQIVKPKKMAFAFPELHCSFGGISLVPDICVLRWQNIPFMLNGRVGNKVSLAPDWIIEILSSGQSPLLVMNKIGLAITNGSELGWLISPSQELIMVYVGDHLPETKRGSDILPVLDVLGDWQISVDNIFDLLKLQ